jgi:predicted nucleic acid-binding protein
MVQVKFTCRQRTRSVSHRMDEIAAQARAAGAVLVTANDGKLRRAEGLVVENWVGR